jgi:hypothetical protein
LCLHTSEFDLKKNSSCISGCIKWMKMKIKNKKNV